jgi:Glyoxalase-like domain
MARLVFDHLVIGAETLEQGLDWAEERLGVVLPPGGTHPRMGTHNRLTALGPTSFLEIIAIDPDAEPPSRPRLFALDDPGVRARLHRRPGLLAWIAGTGDIAASLARAREAGADLGRAVELTRSDLVWLLSIRDDGALPENGTLPSLIEWPEGPHPAGRLTDQGLRLETLELRHPEPAKLDRVLSAIGGDHLVRTVRAERAGLGAVLRSADAARLVLDDEAA